MFRMVFNRKSGEKRIYCSMEEIKKINYGCFIVYAKKYPDCIQNDHDQQIIDKTIWEYQ